MLVNADVAIVDSDVGGAYATRRRFRSYACNASGVYRSDSITPLIQDNPREFHADHKLFSWSPTEGFREAENHYVSLPPESPDSDDRGKKEASDSRNDREGVPKLVRDLSGRDPFRCTRSPHYRSNERGFNSQNIAVRLTLYVGAGPFHE